MKNAIERMPKLKWIHFHMAGVDRYVEMFRAMKNPPKVTNGSGTYDVSISEHSVAMLLAVVRNINKYVLNQKEGKWNYEGRVKEIKDSIAGIVGFGSIGKYSAKLLKGFGAKVYAHKVSEIDKPDYIDEIFYGDEGLDTMLPKCDFVLVFLPGTEDTRGLISRERMQSMKEGTVITNIGRGNVIDSEALADLIEQGHIGGAGLDVTDPEPLPEDHRLWKYDNVLITPHVSYLTPRLKERMLDVFEQNLKSYLAGEKLPNEVGFDRGY
jgi:phosphoglycerate dehydrogenase-like enzyme